MTEHNPLTRTEKVIINLLTSALAWGWPVLLAFVTTPMIVRGLGNDAYGVRSLVVSITGYFALLDLGLAGAVTKYLAEYHVKNDKLQITELLGTTLTTYTVFGLIGGVLIWVLAQWLVASLFSIPPQFQNESIWAFRLSGVGFFLSMITWWGASIPIGIQRFDVFNGISIGFGTLTTLGSLAAVLLGYGLLGVVWANLLSNIIAIIAYWIAASKLFPEIHLRFSFQWKMFKRTISFGLYMVAFRLFSLLFSQLDTLLIGTWISAAAITFYNVPQQVAQLVHSINAKMMQIVFPMACEFSVIGEKQNIERLLLRGLNLSLFLGMVVAIPILVVAQPLLRFWVSLEMAQRSSLVLELLVVTFFLTGLTALTTSFLGGLNYPQFVTIGALVSGLCGLIFYSVLIRPFGIIGAAWSKLLSMIVTIMYYLIVCSSKSGITLLKIGRITIRPLGIGLIVGVLAFKLLLPFVNNMLGVILVSLMTSAIFCVSSWFLGVFDNEEKIILVNLLSRLAITRN
ncbi:MAG: oligosaccharide flippase family protein [Chloroflexi bacterium]|nr:oligosaccharide flippase family protein [Chloroflexota bacterium]